MAGHGPASDRLYTPHLDGPNLRMGLAPITDADWLQVDDQWQRYRRHKLALGSADLQRVYRVLPESAPAVAELVSTVREHLLDAHSDLFSADVDSRIFHVPSGTALAPDTGAPLWSVSTFVQEDLLLLQALDGVYRLTAGSLCLPSRWSLEEKMGEPMRSIHEPVPGLNEHLGDRIDRFFDHLRVDRPVERFNWSLQTDDALAEFPAPDEPIEAVHYRIERQTLRRLPETGAIVFTVRIYVVPLESVATIPGALPQLKHDIDAMPVAFSDYKRMPHFRDALDQFDNPDN